jgi:hypothetical protein
VALLHALGGYEEALKRGGMAEALRFCDRYFLSRSTLATVLDVVRWACMRLVSPYLPLQ